MYASRARACWIVAPLMGESFDVSVSVPSTIAEGRHTLRDGLAGWGCSNVDDVVLVFSELVTNATVHTTAQSRTVITHGPPDLQLHVHDYSHSVPELRLVTRFGGSGLRIVSQLSHSWGWEQTATGKVVWSIISCGH